MSDITKISIVMMLSNTVRILCFAILAVLFDKWWIVLFSALFLNVRSKTTKSETTDVPEEQNVTKGE